MAPNLWLLLRKGLCAEIYLCLFLMGSIISVSAILELFVSCFFRQLNSNIYILNSGKRSYLSLLLHTELTD
jgi:hypothetical protein